MKKVIKAKIISAQKGGRKKSIKQDNEEAMSKEKVI